jgi:transglutaminase-like putative cysteine protease
MKTTSGIMVRPLAVAFVLVALTLPLGVCVVEAQVPSPREIVYVKIYNEVVNNGTTGIPLADTGILDFNYPVEDETQRIVNASAWLNGLPMKFTVTSGEEPSLRIITQASTLNLTPGAKASAWVEYAVEVDAMRRSQSIQAFTDAYITGNASSLESEAQRIYLNTSLRKYIEETPGWNYTNPLTRLLLTYISSQANVSNPVDVVKAVVGYVDSNIVYSIRMPPREPWETLLYMEGDCDDQSNLVVTLLRGLGIPSYQEYGMVFVSKDFRLEEVSDNGFLNTTMVGGGGHAWAVAYIPPWGWIRIDTVFGVPGDWLSHIVSIPYYTYPTVVMGANTGEATQVAWLSFENEISNARLKYQIVYEVSLGEQV